ncbi:enoyl-CoA hydratase/isomerase family protein [Halococcus thailandensis]|uniref:Enoyl-CoA hydratase n=1 Tax=Halococcus thailandensis JCM 13552 TaxID=1227457 RepID=M0N8Y5_9EURY|nr:enoyl-CoA hydratase/isomerase family protein [Halococcus thailandensis]EMA53554.1 enoyl-CoA hydratase [Halococcus thailandensis JCM 13552]
MITTSIDGAVGIVTLDRPRKRNALSPAGLDELEAAIEALDTPVVHLRGAGPAFCAGADLRAVAELDGEEAHEFARSGQRVANAIERSESVVVAGIDGAARGGGVELTLACDVRIATPEASFAETGVRLSLFGAWGGTHRLPAVVGAGNARDLALSGRTIDAEEALRMGLISRIVDDPTEVVASIADHDPAALAAIKRRLRDDAPPEKQDRREAAAFADLVEDADLADYR